MKLEEIVELIRENKIKKGIMVHVYLEEKEIIKRVDAIWNGKYFVTGEKNDISLEDVVTFDSLTKSDFFIEKLSLVGTDFSRQNIVNCEKEETDTLAILYDENIFIGYWILDTMGYNFVFVCDRFLDLNLFKGDVYLLELIEKGQKILNNKFRRADVYV